MARLEPIVFPALPFCEHEFTHGGPISRLPLAPTGQDDTYALLLTSDDLKPNPRHFGALRRERESLRAPLHALLSVLVSQRANTADAQPGYETRTRAQLVVRTFVPDPARPEVFALLLHVVVGAKWVPLLPHERNLSATEKPPAAPPPGQQQQQQRGPRGGGAAARAPAEEAGLLDLWGLEAPPDAEPEAEAEAPAAGGRRGGAQAGRRRSLLAIFDVTGYVSDVFNLARRDRFLPCTNARALLPPAPGSVRGGAPAPKGPWDLLHLPDRLGEVAYLRAVYQELVLWPAQALRGELTTESMREPLDANRRLEVQEASGPLPFGEEAVLTEFRVALSLTNALARLRRWLAAAGAVHPDAAQWGELGAYVASEARLHASPPGCTVFVVPTRSNTPSLSDFLYLELPRVRGAADVLRQADVQLALMRHPLRSEQLAVYDAVTRLGLDHDGQLWLSGMRRHVAQVRASMGSLSAARELRTDVELTAFLSERIYHERRIAAEVGLLREQTEREACALVERATAEPWELQRLRAKALSDLQALAASGRDNNRVLQASHLYFEEGVSPAAEGVAVDHAAELENYRALFGRRHFADLVDASAMLAAFGVGLRTASGLITYWRECLFVALVSMASFLDQDGRVHIEIYGRPAAGKTVVVLGVQFVIPEEFLRFMVYESNASMRESEPTLHKNVAVLNPEYGAMGEHEDLRNRAVDLSRMSEPRTKSRTVRMTEDNRRTMEETDQFHSWSRVVATNIPSSDEAMRSRVLRLLLNPLDVSGKCFGEALAADDEERPVLTPLAEGFRRGLHFFTRCVAAFCMLVNAGVVDLPPNSLNVAIVNRLMPQTTDASNARLYKQLYKLARLLDVWAAVHQFLTCPLSPLTVVHNDRFGFAALADVRVLLRPQCTTGLFLASATPYLGEDVVLRRVVDLLLRTVLAADKSRHPAARKQFERLCRDVRRDVADVRRRETQLRNILLQCLPALFPAPRPLAAGASSSSAAAEAEASTEAVFFPLESLVAQPAPESLAAAGGGAGRRPVVDDWDEASMAPATSASEEEAAAAAGQPPGARRVGQTATGFSHFWVLPGDDNSRAAAPSAEPAGYGRVLEPLGDEEAERALHRVLVELRRQLQRDWRGAPPVAAGSRANMAARRAAGQGGEGGGSDAALHEHIRGVLTRLQLRFYRGGWESVDARCLDCDDNARVERETKRLVEEFDVPAGGYVLYPLTNPCGVRAAEAFSVQVAAEPREGVRRGFEELLDCDGGRTNQAQKLRVALRLAAGPAGEVPPVRPVRRLAPEEWQGDARTFLLERSGLGLEPTQQATLRRAGVALVGPLADRRRWVLELVAAACFDDSARGYEHWATLDELAGKLYAGGVGQWRPGLLLVGAPRSYHDVEADPDGQQARKRAAAAAGDEALETPRRRRRRRGAEPAEAEAAAAAAL